MLYYETDYLAHHGVKGQKWGRRKQKIKTGVKKGFVGVRNVGKATMNTQQAKKVRSGISNASKKLPRYENGRLKSPKRIAVDSLKSTGHKTVNEVGKLAGTGKTALQNAFKTGSFN